MRASGIPSTVSRANGGTPSGAWTKYTTSRPVSLGQVSRKLRPAPPPLEANDQLVTAVITAAWAIGLISLLVLRDDLPPGQRWWVWTCAVGLCLGLFGLWYVPRLKRARSRQAERRSTAGG
jgi:Protein of unknown function (DUF2530)